MVILSSWLSMYTKFSGINLIEKLHKNESLENDGVVKELMGESKWLEFVGGEIIFRAIVDLAGANEVCLIIFVKTFFVMLANHSV